MSTALETEAQLRRELPTPEPVPSAFAYRLERWKALASSPKRLTNYIRYRNSVRTSAQINYLPIKMDIENVSRCNFRCTMCQVSGWTNFKRAEDMPFENFKHLIDHSYGLVEIKLQGMGEPTLGGDTYFRMIRYARSKWIWVRTVTNASLLHVNNNYKKLIDAGPNEVQISVDGATKDTFEKIRRGSNFERVKTNCRLINDYCNGKNLLRTKMWTVVQRDNIHELEALVELAHELGFKSMVLSLNLTDWGQDKWNEANRQVTVDDSVSPEMAHRLLEQGARLGVKVTFWNITSKYDWKSPKKLCPWPFERAYVSSDMRIVPCCMIANPDVAELGNAGDFNAAWHSDVYENFRQAHLDGRIPKICQGCYVASGHTCESSAVSS